jgi:PKD repeat protein
MITALLAAMLLQTAGANPYVTVSAIDTSGGIVASRTTGQTPMFLQVSASSITATGTDRPFEDLTYSWDFGDQLSEPILHPITGEVIDAGTQQTGPEAAYVYRQPGTYTITLTVSGSGITETVTQTVTVTQHVPSQTIYYDSVNGDNANDGSKPETARQSFGGAVIAQNVVYSFARGGTYSLPHIPGWRDGWRFVAHGSGPRPIVRCIGFDGFYMNTGNLSDMVLQGLELRQGNASHIVFANAGNGVISNIYFDDCLITPNPQRTVGNAVGFHLFRRVDGFGLWRCKTDMADTLTSGEYLGSAAGNWRFMVGVEMAGGVGDAATKGRETGHNVYTGDEDHQLFRWCAFGTGTPVDRLSNVHLNADYAPCQFVQVDQCLLRGHWMWFQQKTNIDSHPEDVVFSSNEMRDLSPYATKPAFGNDQYAAAWMKKGNRFTFRDNTVRLGRSLFAWVDPAINAQVYRNAMTEGTLLGVSTGYSRDNYVIGQPVPDPVPTPDPVPLPEPDPVGSELLLKLKLDADGNVIGVQIIKDAK